VTKHRLGETLRIRLTPEVMARAFTNTFRRRGARALFTVQKVFQLSPAELGQLFGVRRPTIEQWLSAGVPIRYAAVVDRTAEIAIYLNRLFKSERLPIVAREKLTGLGNRSMLEVLRTEGADPMYAFLRGLHELIPGADPIAPKLPLRIESVVKELAELAGVVVTGTVGNVKNERSVRQWITGERRPERETQLRFAHLIASTIAATCCPLVVQSWFKGANTSLGDRAPAIVLRDDFTEETKRAILNAARRLAR
jgi:hypothetical protein